MGEDYLLPKISRTTLDGTLILVCQCCLFQEYMNVMKRQNPEIFEFLSRRSPDEQLASLITYTSLLRQAEYNEFGNYSESIGRK